MMQFVSFEARRRSRFVERVQKEVIEVLSWEETQAVLGKFAVDLLCAAEALYVPNIKDGTVSAPKKHRDANTTPVIAMKPGETLRLDASLKTMSPEQRLRVAETAEAWAIDEAKGFAGWDVVECIEKAFKRWEYAWSIDGYNGRVTYPAASSTLSTFLYPNLGGDNTRIFTGKPIAMLSMSDDTPCSRLKGEAVLAHELQHVVQALSNPIMPFNTDEYLQVQWRKELEAYHVGANYQALRTSDGDVFAGVPDCIVEQIRQEYASLHDSFYPNPRIVEAIGQAGLGTLGIASYTTVN